MILGMILGILIGILIMNYYFKEKKCHEDEETRKEIEDLLKRAKENPKKKHRNKGR